jgi:hypothetical protein
VHGHQMTAGAQRTDRSVHCGLKVGVVEIIEDLAEHEQIHGPRWEVGR